MQPNARDQERPAESQALSNSPPIGGVAKAPPQDRRQGQGHCASDQPGGKEKQSPPAREPGSSSSQDAGVNRSGGNTAAIFCSERLSLARFLKVHAPGGRNCPRSKSITLTVPAESSSMLCAFKSA